MDTALVRGALPQVRWSAVAAGVVFALAAHVCLGLFGAALGFAAQGAESRALGVAAGFWALISSFLASLLGASVACRIAEAYETRAAWLHGLLVWGLGLVLGALFLSGTLAGSAMGTSYIWNGGIVANDAVRDTGPGTALEGAARDAAAASLLGGFATLAGLLGAITGILVAQRVADQPVLRPRAAATPGMMPPPERRTDLPGDTIWSDPAFDRRRSAVPDRRQHH